MAVVPATAECIIIGGGVVGCSLAYHLTLEGRRPLLLERAELAAGSTARCAGGFRQQFSTEVNVRVGILSRRLLERFQDDLGADVGLRQIGYLMLATTAELAARFRADVVMQRAAGLTDVELLNAAQVRDLLPELRTDDLHAATFCPTDGLAGPSEVTLGYAAAARRNGARIAEGCDVTGIEQRGGRVAGVVLADGSRITSEVVVNCAGAHAGPVGAMAGVEVPVLPYRRHIFVTAGFSLGRPIPMTVDLATSFYMHPEGVGFLLGMSDPAEASSWDTTVAHGFLEHLVEHATWRLPALERASIQTGWAGLYEVTPDHQAIVGEAPGLAGFWLCCGFSGHGLMQAPAMGLLLAQSIAGRTPDIDLAPYHPGRFAHGGLTPELAVI